MASVTKDVKAFKKTFKETGSIRRAAVSAGYSQNTADLGLQRMPKAIRTYVLTRRKKLSKLAQLAHDFSSQDQENVVRGALLANVAAGKDQACKSLELLGKDKRVSMFTPDSQTGVIVIQAAALPALPGTITPLVQSSQAIDTISAESGNGDGT